jgi:hypothetical protein
MKSIILTLMAVAATSATFAGSPGKAPVPMLPPPEEPVFGRATLGGKFSDDLQSGYLDAILGLSVNDNHALFLNLRGTLDDSDQEIFSAGLGFRVLLEDPGIIIGANAYYDSIGSAAGNQFDQFGFGAEVLSKWVDARFNYYLPEDGAKRTGSVTTSSTRRIKGDIVRQGNRRVQEFFRETTTTRIDLFEVALQGWNAEIGFLVPGIEQFIELRLFAGAYGYDNPVGGDFEGVKARAEARLTEWLTLDFEYWDDKELVGGNWVAGFRVSHPFDLGALLSGQNPFRKGSPAADLPSSRSLRDRMDEMVLRSHRVYTVNGPPQDNTSTSEEFDGGVTVGTIAPPPPPPPPPSFNPELPPS